MEIPEHGLLDSRHIGWWGEILRPSVEGRRMTISAISLDALRVIRGWMGAVRHVLFFMLCKGEDGVRFFANAQNDKKGRRSPSS